MTETFDVAVIGAGVHGASAAAHLAKRGVRVVVIEAGAVAGGATAASTAVCRAYYSNPFLAEVARDAMARFNSFADFSEGGEAGFVRTGMLFLHGPDDLAAVQRDVAALTRLGTELRILDVADLRAEFPGFEVSDLAIAVFESGAGRADPVATTRSLIELAQRHGAQLRLRTRLTALAPRSAQGAVQVGTSAGEFSVQQVLLATGPATRQLAGLVGCSLPLTVERHVVSTNVPGPCPPVPLPLADVPGGYYCTTEPSGAFCLGSLESAEQADPERFATGVSEAESLRSLAALVKRIPEMADAAPTGGWAGLYDVSPDWMPVLGEIAAGVFVDAGTSGHGFKLAPSWGAHVAAVVLGADPRPELAQFHPDRFRTQSLLPGGYGTARILG